jgi:PPOX class probable F420-dependent enzyme
MPETMVAGTSITPELRDWLMAELRFPVAATIGADGMPSQSVVWFDFDSERDETVLLNTRAGRLKERHLRRDPRISLCFEDGYRYVTLEGRAELIDDPERGLEDIQNLARRYGDSPDPFVGQHRVTILVRVERVIRHD